MHHFRQGLPLIQKKSVKRWIPTVIVGLIVIYLFVLMPVPYYILKPGTAENIRPMVKLGAEDDGESGTLMLTTVGVYNANLSLFLWAKLRHQEIQRKQNFRQKGESEQEYDQRQQFVMRTSQANAIQAAYGKLAIPYQLKSDGVIVLRTLENMPAANVFQSGDAIVELNDKPVTKRDELLKELEGKKEGDSLSISYRRGDELRTAELTLAPLPTEDEKAEKRIGLGIVTGDSLTIEANRPEQQVTIEAGAIGGPSAGLMFSLQIYNQLSPGDITKGYRIAGTGEITVDGKVGAIGGIQHKLAAANREQADIFFAPKDYTNANGNRVTNASDAEAAAKKLNAKIKIVPVSTMQEALDYLASLPPKS
jgi:PDZ domain-containing protein